MTRRALLLLPILLLAGCGGQEHPAPAIDRLLRGGGSAYFVLDGTVDAAVPIPVHAEGYLSPNTFRAQGSTLGASGRVALHGRRLLALRQLLRKASWSGSPDRVHVELDVSRKELMRIVPGEVPRGINQADVSATVVFTSLNLRSSSNGGS